MALAAPPPPAVERVHGLVQVHADPAEVAADLEQRLGLGPAELWPAEKTPPHQTHHPLGAAKAGLAARRVQRGQILVPQADGHLLRSPARPKLRLRRGRRAAAAPQHGLDHLAQELGASASG
nr:hypothetical protein [Phenylobacterium zucineum]